MSEILTYLPLVSPVATLVVVFVGILFSNRHVDTRISDLLRSFDDRFKALDERFKAIDERFKGIDERFKAIDERFNALQLLLDERFKAADERFMVFQRAVDQRFTDAVTRLEARIDLRASEVRLEIVELRQRVERLEEQRLVK